MKRLEDYINEELILEKIIGYLENYKITLYIIPHGEDRQTKDDRPYVSKHEISWTIAKVAKNIQDDFNEKLINYKDRIQIIDKSRNVHLNVLCDICKDIKISDSIKLSIITIKEGNMPTHDIKKIYTTYSSDNKVKNEVSLFKNQL